MKIPKEIERELSALTKSGSYKSLRAYWYLRLAEIAWQLTAAPSDQIARLQGQAEEIKTQIRQITVISNEKDFAEAIFEEEGDRIEAKSQGLAQRLQSENATMEAEVKDNIIEKV